jgi:hypothetical protein
VGVDSVLLLLAAPVLLPLFTSMWRRADLAEWIQVLVPNVILLIVPGGLAAGLCLLVGEFIRRESQS